MKIKVVLDGPMDGIFGDAMPASDSCFIYVDYIWAYSKSSPEFVRLFAAIVVHEQLEIECQSELGDKGRPHRWSLDLLHDFDIEKIAGLGASN